MYCSVHVDEAVVVAVIVTIIVVVIGVALIVMSFIVRKAILIYKHKGIQNFLCLGYIVEPL